MQESSNRTAGRIFFILIVLILIGSSLLFITGPLLFMQFSNNKKENCTVEVQAQVIEMVSKQSASRVKRNGRTRTTTTTVYAPKVTFTDEKGVTHTVTHDSYSNPPVCEPGDIVRVLYDPNDPDSILLPDHDKSFTGFLSVFIVIGVLELLIPIAMIAGSIKMSRKKKAEADIFQ